MTSQPSELRPASRTTQDRRTARPLPFLMIPGGAENGVGSLHGLSVLLGEHCLAATDGTGTGDHGHEGAWRLVNRADSCHRAILEFARGPAVVVGHSLGGVVAVQLAMDHPGDVAGLVLLDPTPFTDLRTTTRLRRSSRLLALPGRLPVIGERVDRALARQVSLAPAGSSQPSRDAPSVLGATAAALSSLPREGRALAKRMHPLGVPVLVVTADREVGNPMRRSHDQIARALGGQVRRLPGAGHAMHLTHVEDCAGLVRELVAALPPQE